MQPTETGKDNGVKVKSLKRAFGFGLSAEVVLIAFIAAILFQVVISMIIKSDAVYSWVAVVSNQVIFCVAVLLFCKYKSVSYVEITGFARPPKLKYFLLFLPIAFLAVASFAPLASLFSRLIAKAGYSYSPDYHIAFTDPALFTVSLLALGILPAIGEETLLRGALLSGAKTRSIPFALFYSSLVFALIHGNAVQLVHQFLLGCLMGYFALATRSVYASATIHFVNNATALLLDHGAINGWINKTFYSYFDASFSFGLSEGTFALFVVLSWVLLIGFSFLATFLLKRDKEKENGAPYEKGRGDLLTYLATPSLKEKEKEEERATAKGVRLIEPEPTIEGEAVLHVVLLALLAMILVAGVLSEVLK